LIFEIDYDLVIARKAIKKYTISLLTCLEFDLYDEKEKKKRGKEGLFLCSSHNTTLMNMPSTFHLPKSTTKIQKRKSIFMSVFSSQGSNLPPLSSKTTLQTIYTIIFILSYNAHINIQIIFHTTKKAKINYKYLINISRTKDVHIITSKLITKKYLNINTPNAHIRNQTQPTHDKALTNCVTHDFCLTHYLLI